MSDHDHVELIAAAQVQVIGGAPGTVNFSSNHGFEEISFKSTGVYELRLGHKHDDHKIVVGVTAKGTVAGSIQAEILGSGDVDGILVTNLAPGGIPTDTSFFITVQRVRS